MSMTASTNQTRPARRPRVLLSAYSCCPNRGSEPGIGWNRAVEIAKHCDTWVLTEGNDWPERINAYLAEQGPIANLNFIYVRRRAWEKRVEYKAFLNHHAYRCWQERAFGVAERLHAEIGFDLVHQVTFNSFRSPSYLHRLGVPFVWGPIGGAQSYPSKFLRGAGLSNAAMEATRTLLTELQLRFSGGVRGAARRTAAAFSANSETQSKLLQHYGLRSELLCDVGVPEPPAEPPIEKGRKGPLRIIWSGVHSTRKALELLIEALAMLPRGVEYELRVLGDGPQRARWQKLTEARGIADRVRWCGNLSHAEAVDQFRWADVFVFTSLRDTSGTVLLEAMSAGRPVVCLDHQGAADMVTDACGVKIPVTDRENVQQRLADAIASLNQNRSRLVEMGVAAHERATGYAWSAQTPAIVAAYNRVLESAGSDARCESEQGVPGVAPAVAPLENQICVGPVIEDGPVTLPMRGRPGLA